MARNSVDLPTPEGPTTSVDSCGTSARSPTWASLRPSGSARSTSGSDRIGPSAATVVMRGSRVSSRADALERVLERSQTLDGGAEIGEPDVAVDEEVHRAVDGAEGVGGLAEAAEVDHLHVIERRDHDDRE